MGSNWTLKLLHNKTEHNQNRKATHCSNTDRCGSYHTKWIRNTEKDKYHIAYMWKKKNKTNVFTKQKQSVWQCYHKQGVTQQATGSQVWCLYCWPFKFLWGIGGWSPEYSIYIHFSVFLWECHWKTVCWASYAFFIYSLYHIKTDRQHDFYTEAGELVTVYSEWHDIFILCISRMGWILQQGLR